MGTHTRACGIRMNTHPCTWQMHVAYLSTRTGTGALKVSQNEASWTPADPESVMPPPSHPGAAGTMMETTARKDEMAMLGKESIRYSGLCSHKQVGYDERRGEERRGGEIR